MRLRKSEEYEGWKRVVFLLSSTEIEFQTIIENSYCEMGMLPSFCFACGFLSFVLKFLLME